MPNKPKATDLYDVASLSISNDPFVGRKRKEGSKYDAIFSKLKIGQRLVCHSDAAARLASQLKQWLVTVPCNGGLEQSINQQTTP